MKLSLVVIAVVVVTVRANVVGRSGWGSSKPSVNLELNATGAAEGTAQASAAQAVLEQAVGNVDVPAYLISYDGVIGAVSQVEEVNQYSVADKPSGATYTVNDGYVENQALSADALDAYLIGDPSASVLNHGETGSSGEGTISFEESTLNVSESRKETDCPFCI